MLKAKAWETVSALFHKTSPTQSFPRHRAIFGPVLDDVRTVLVGLGSQASMRRRGWLILSGASFGICRSIVQVQLPTIRNGFTVIKQNNFLLIRDLSPGSQEGTQRDQLRTKTKT